MSLPKLYLETTIPSYLTARRSRDLRLAAHQEVTDEWWTDHRHEYELYISGFVREEAAVGNPSLAVARLALLDGIAVFPATVEDLAETACGWIDSGKGSNGCFSHRNSRRAWNGFSSHVELHPHSQSRHHPARGAHLRRQWAHLPGDLQPRRTSAILNKLNNIIAEIHRVREKQAAECDYDVHKMGERMRQRQREEISHGVRYARLKRDAKFAEAYEQERRVWELGQVLAKARENAGLTQEALAKKMGTTRSAVCRYERQPTNLKISTLEKVARAMGRKLVVKLA